MKMKLKTILLLASPQIAFCGLLNAVPMSEFQLNVRADTVLPIENRQTVLMVTDRILHRADVSFVELLADLPNPFRYESRVAVAESAVVAPEPEPEAEPQLSEQEILAQIASILSARITGSLERGGNHFVQLSGGELLRAGTRLPVRLPTIREEAFMIDIVTISPTGLLLELGESRLAMPMPSTSSGGARLSPSSN